MTTELDVNQPSIKTPDIVQAQSIGLSNQFQTSVQFQVPMPQQAFEYADPQVDVDFNFEAFENAGMLEAQEIKIPEQSEAFMGLFAAVGSLTNDVSDSVSGPQPDPAPASAPQPEITAELQKTWTAPVTSFDMKPVGV